MLAGLDAQNTLVVDADLLYTNTGEGLHRFVDPLDGETYLYSQFETADAKRMYACFDQPDGLGKSGLHVFGLRGSHRLHADGIAPTHADLAHHHRASLAATIGIGVLKIWVERCLGGRLEDDRFVWLDCCAHIIYSVLSINIIYDEASTQVVALDRKRKT